MIHLKAHVHLRFKLTVTIVLHLRYTLHMLVPKNTENDSIKCELKGHSMLHMKVQLRFHFKKH